MRSDQKISPTSRAPRNRRNAAISHENVKILITDAVILILVLIATNVLAEYLIPYINKTYHLSADAVDVGSLDLFSSLFAASPSEWFSTQIEGLELPQYRWYIALAIAWMVQVIANDLSSYLRFEEINIGGRIRNFAVSRIISSLIVSAVFSAFMMQMTNFFIITVCPQDIPVLIMIAEILLFCLPAFIHFILSRPSFSIKGLAFQAVNILLLFLMTKSDSGFLSFLLVAVNFAGEISDAFFENEDESGSKDIPAARLAGVLVTAVWVGAGIAFIRPIVYTHMPTVERTVEEVYCDDVSYGDNGYTIFIRTDGCAIDSGNNVLGEDMMQVDVCGYNAFMLSNDHVLYVTDGENTIPTVVREHIVWISHYKDRLLAIDEDGNALGFGDYGNYLPDEPCYDDFEVIASGHKFVKGDIGEEHILLIDEDGNLYGMGCNSTGELGNGTTSFEPQELTEIMTGVSLVKAGKGTSYALTTDGKVYAWGRNDVWQLGFEAKSKLVTAPQEMNCFDKPVTDITVGAESAFAIDSDGNLWAWGRGGNSTATKPFILLKDILKADACKVLGSGSNAIQYLYIIDTDHIAYRKTLGSADAFDIESSEIIFDTSAWMPEPIEEINSALEDFLKKLNIAGNTAEEEEEEEDAEPEVSALYIPGNEGHAASWYREYNGHRYRIYDECMGMGDAERYCEAMGGHLATITTEDELSFINTIALAMNDVSPRGIHRYHIGLLYEGKYQWVTGEDTSLVRSLCDEPVIKDDGEGIFDPSEREPEMMVGAGQSLPFICEWD